MKTLFATAVAMTLSFSVSNADQFRLYNSHSPCSSSGYDSGYNYQRDPKGLFLHRINIAPTSFGCNVRSDLHAVKQAGYSARKVDLLGKIEYRSGNSYLGYEAKHDIKRLILGSGLCHSPNALIVVMGYADKSGPSDVNYRLSESRAKLVEKHISHLGWEHGLKLQTTSIAMGEEVELRNHGLKHNRVAEIWVVEFPHPVSRIISVVEPVIEQRTVFTTPVAAVSRPVLQAPVPQAFIQPGAAPQLMPAPAPVPVQPQIPNGFAPPVIPQPAPQPLQPETPEPAPPTTPLTVPPTEIPPVENEIIPAPQAAPNQSQIAPDAPVSPQPKEASTTPALPEIVLQTPTPLPGEPLEVNEQAQLLELSTPANPLAGLASFLEQNIVLTNEADRNEFAQKLEALKNMASNN